MENYIIALLLLLYFDLMALFYAKASDMFSRSQLVGQFLLVLLIPFLGALVVFLFSRSQIEPVAFKKKKERVGFRFASALFLSFFFTQSTSEYSSSGNTNDPSNIGDGGSSD